ncbi:MAG: hypothetical protein M1379_15095 [Firmicutes bacterium]|nr:hypothetical protein [Bacillota bacterium]
MKIAAVIDNEGNVLPLPDGQEIIIYDIEGKTQKKYHNPGFDLETNRRSATTDFMAQNGVNIVCTVPATFCPVSRDKAKEYSLKFIRLQKGAKFQEVLLNIDKYLSLSTDDIPDDELFKRVKL